MVDTKPDTLQDARMWVTEPYRTAVALQRLMRAIVEDDEERAADRASAARVWCELEETKRKLKMRPLPKSVDVTQLPRKTAHAQLTDVPFTEVP